MRASASPASQDGRSAAAEQELQAFSYMVAHDLGASFRHLAEFSRLLVSDLESLTERQQSFADHILGAAAKCQAMMDQLLAFSRAQQKVLQIASRDATAVLRLCHLQLSAQALAADAEIVTEPLGAVDADMELLASAMFYLLDNAIKFRQPGVRPRILIQAAHDEAFWRMRIIDNGIGVEPAHRERAFQMFQRLNSEDAYPGIGAGLTICRRIARRHGGEARFLDCEQGACVELALPRALPG